MRFPKLNRKLLVALLAIVALSLIESRYLTESTGVLETTRKIGYILCLGGVLVTGFLYWKNEEPKWMKGIWLIVYLLIFIFLIAVNLLNRKVAFSITFLDQVHYMRVFFNSPVPFMLALVVSGLEFNQRDSSTDGKRAS